MFKEDIPAFLRDFGDSVVYTNNSISEQFKAIIDHNIELIGYEGEVSERVTTMTFESNDNVVIGGIVSVLNDSYTIDGVISDDKAIKTVSMVKQ